MSEAAKRYRIGIIGLGDMANAHIQGLSREANAVVAAICDVNPAALAEAGHRLGIPQERRYSDYRLLIQDEEVDAVISVTPNAVHASIMLACLEAGKPFLSEKPFTMHAADAELVKEAYEQLSSPVPGMIGFSYRYTPAFRYARTLLQQEKIGKALSFSVQYLQGWGSAVYEVPYVWRFDRERTGTGTLGDLGSHMIDLAHYLIGPFEELSARLETFVHERSDVRTGEPRKVEVDDYACFQARMASGAIGQFQTSRNAVGSGNQLEISIYGEQGTLHASTLTPEQVVWIEKDAESGEIVEKKLTVPWPLRLGEWTDFVNMLGGEAADGLPDLMAGYHNQLVLDAVIRSSEQRRTVAVYEEQA